MNKKYLLFLLFILIINLTQNGKFELHYDEAYYWAFSQNLDLSYFDHPPMVAYLIRLFSIFGHNVFVVRLVSFCTTLITVTIIYKLAKRMFDQRVADLAILLAISSLLIEAMFFIVTPDSPLLMFWGITLYCFYIGVFETKNQYIYLSGFFAGLALLSKYTAILIFPSLFIFLLLSENYRKILIQKEVYLAFLISIVLFIPVIYWNSQHNWISFKFQLNHGMDLSQKFNLLGFFDFLNGQFFISGIFIFVALIFYVFKYSKVTIKDDKLAFLFWPFIFVFTFFAYRSLFQPIEANWPAPCYFTGIIWLAYWLRVTGTKWVYKASVYLIVIVIILLKFPLVFMPKFLTNTPAVAVVKNFYGERELLSQVKPYIHKNDYVLACDYGNASKAWFYLKLPRAYVLNNFKFSHEYQFWNNDLPKPIPSAIYICDNEDITALNDLKKDFRVVTLLKIAKYQNKIGDKNMYIYQAIN